MKVLFVCTGNTCRSPMAEGILRDFAEKKSLDIEVKSAGVAALDGSYISKNSIEAMKNIGIDIQDYTSNMLTKYMVEEFDLVLTMSNSHKQLILNGYNPTNKNIFTIQEYINSTNRDVIDPYGGNLNIYEQTRDEIYQLIDKGISEGKL